MPIYRRKNDLFFKKWTSEMAYVLGFFTADGNMIRNKRGGCFIEFQITDRSLLFKIRTLLKSNHKITTRKRNQRRKISYRLQIGSKQIFNDLLNLGLRPCKSKVIGLPEVPDLYFNHFVRGYFDGDGNVTISSYERGGRNIKKSITILSGFISGSIKFLKGLKLKLKKLAKLKGGSCYFTSNSYRLYYSVGDSRLLCQFMYRNTKNKLYLNRKKKKFERYFGKTI